MITAGVRLVSGVALAGAVLFSIACSQGLNWREVHMGEVTAMLPCKPDAATRQITLDNQPYDMDVIGCEVAGALFAISHIQTKESAQAPLVMANLRAASLAAVQASKVHPMPDSGDSQSSFDVQVDGVRPNGTLLQVRFKWFVLGKEVYQLGAYASTLSEDQTETLMHEVRIK